MCLTISLVLITRWGSWRVWDSSSAHPFIANNDYYIKVYNILRLMVKHPMSSAFFRRPIMVKPSISSTVHSRLNCKTSRMSRTVSRWPSGKPPHAMYIISLMIKPPI